MAERIAITPPDREGNQTYWNDYSSILGGRVLAPDLENLPPGVLEMLVIASRAKNLSDIASLGKILSYGMDTFVLSDGTNVFKIENQPFLGSYLTGFERNLRWVSCNQMLANALSLEAKGAPEQESGYGEFAGLRIKTPDYLGLMATVMPEGGFVCVTAMSDESQGRHQPKADVHRELIRPYLDHTCLAVLHFAYPQTRQNTVSLDGHEGNVLVGPADIVRLDLHSIA